MDMGIKNNDGFVNKGYPPVVNIHKKRKYLVSENNEIEEYVPEQNVDHSNSARQEEFGNNLNDRESVMSVPKIENSAFHGANSNNGYEQEEDEENLEIDDKDSEKNGHLTDPYVYPYIGIERINELNNEDLRKDDDLNEEEIREYEGIFADSEDENEHGEEGDKEWHTCKVCKKVFFAKKTLTKHVNSCHRVKNQLCKICNKPFANTEHLAMHMKAVHVNHKPYLCDICGHTFSNANSLKNHREIHAEVKSYTATCEECGKGFTNMNYLNSHRLTHSTEKPFPCEECGKKFRRFNALKYHMRVHTNERPHECEVCGKNFTQASSLKTHLKVHGGEKLHSCTVCSEKFFRKSDVKSHMRTHTKEKPFHCDVCNKDFAQSSSLKTHMKTHDENNKTHLCSLCGDTFALKNTLNIHLMRHRGEKPHKCLQCGKGFTQSSTLKTHMKIHSKTGAKPRKERTKKIEDKPITSTTDTSPTVSNLDSTAEFQTDLNIKEGESLNNKLQCDLCDKVFASKNALKVHVMRHKGEKPHKCHMCPKSFTQSGSLKIHMRTHTGDKPYACDTCGMAFTYSYSKQKHNCTGKDDIGDTPIIATEENDPESVVQLTPLDDEDAVENVAALQEMKMKILQTLGRAKEGDYEEEEEEDDDKEVESEEETQDSVASNERMSKDFTPIDFYSSFQATLTVPDEDVGNEC